MSACVSSALNRFSRTSGLSPWMASSGSSWWRERAWSRSNAEEVGDASSRSLQICGVAFLFQTMGRFPLGCELDGKEYKANPPVPGGMAPSLASASPIEAELRTVLVCRHKQLALPGALLITGARRGLTLEIGGSMRQEQESVALVSKSHHSKPDLHYECLA